MPDSSRLRLPTELLREITQLYVSTLPTAIDEFDRLRNKPEWKFVESLSLTSKTFRELAMEAWFATYVITLPDQPLELSQWTQFKVHKWARYDRSTAGRFTFTSFLC